MISIYRSFTDNFFKVVYGSETYNILVDNIIIEPDPLTNSFLIKDAVIDNVIIGIIVFPEGFKFNDVIYTAGNFKALASLIQEKLFFVVHD